ncbi:hypothetical protein PT276_03330 [Orbaceae bacterium ESL0721]|nr:hypothetical protein [Orbaceae bacterium ESL0721]
MKKIVKNMVVLLSHIPNPSKLINVIKLVAFLARKVANNAVTEQITLERELLDQTRLKESTINPAVSNKTQKELTRGRSDEKCN